MISTKLSIVLTGFLLVFLVAGCLEPPAPSPAPLPTQAPGESFSERCMPSAPASTPDNGGTVIVDDCTQQQENQPAPCKALNGDEGITGKLAKPQILNQWSWSDTVLPMDALDASNSKGVYGDAHQFFIVLFKKLKFAQEVAQERETTQPIDALLSFELLLKPDNYAEALKAFDESRNTQFFEAPSWFTQEWFVLSQIPESESPALQFDPAEIQSPGRYRVRIHYSDLNPAVVGQEALFVVTQDNQYVPRYNTLTISFEKTADPETPNPLYWISLNKGLQQNSDFGVQFTTEDDSENRPLLWTDSLNANEGFSVGKKNVLLLSSNSFEAINNPEVGGMVLRMHPEAQWIIFSPNTPISIGARVNSSDHTNWTYRFIQNDSAWSPENATTILKWNAITSTSASCEGVPRNISDQWNTQSDCDNGPGFTAQLSNAEGPSTTGEIIATTTVFVPANQSWAMYSCTTDVPLADTVQIQNNNVFELKRNPDSETQLGVSSIQDIVDGIEKEEICVVTKNNNGELLDEMRFEWNAQLLEWDQISAAGHLGVSDFTACPFYSAPIVETCEPTTVEQPKSPEKAIQPGLYNAGFQITEIPYFAKDETKWIPLLIWYPTTAPTTSYFYSSFHPESEVAVDAPIAEGTFPLILFSHGNMTTGVQSSFLTEYLAQRGYIIVATDYDDALFDSRTGEPIAPGGVPFYGRWFPDLWSDGSPALYRRDESHTILEKVCSLNTDSHSQFFGHLDFSRMGAVGHSFGGYTIAGLIGGYESWREPDIKAAVLQAPFLAPFEFDSGDLSQISIPVMLQGGTADFFTIESPTLQELAKKISPPKHFLIFNGFDHFAWSDLPCQEFGSIAACRNDPKSQAILSYTTAFLDYYIKGDTSAKAKLYDYNPLLTVFENQN
ncbi:hypothetical protein KKE06_05635 [Candidatus Micrarchaeota archaeon]|nr:hypothetical protein [Candidatus Micrarchaeota archaeon]MBU1930018.1 hypothetical protein [Candidatus Micrarchaeota archaeon]